MTGRSALSGPPVDQAWVTAVERLWPDADVTCARRGTMRGGRRELAFLPDATHPRLLLPAGMPRAAAAALRRYSHDLGLRQRLTRGLTAAAVRTGLPERSLHERLHITGGGESIEDHLGGLLHRPVVVSIGLGTARANRKPILHVLTPGGEQVAFVKVADTATAHELIDWEAAALAHLAAHPPRDVHVPEVLHHGDWQGLGLLVLSPLPTSARGWRPRRQAPLAAMRALFGTAEVWSGPLAGSAYWAGIRQGPASLSEPAAGTRLASAIARIGETWGGEILEFGAWHGDWTPWNMAWHGGTIRLWDFERYTCGVPWGFDLLHYRLQEQMRRVAEPPYTAWPEEAAGLLAPLGLTGRAAAATVQLYFLELCHRYLLAAQGPIGEPLRPQAERLLDLLDDNAGRTS